jgi:hypothetical protein
MADNEVFSTGAVRDNQTDKLRYDLMSPLAARRIAQVFTKGAKKYGDRNWEKGMPFSRVLASALRHIESYKLGDVSEDHLAHAAWNLEALLHYEEMIKLGRLSANLSDLPDLTHMPLAVPLTPLKTDRDPNSFEEWGYNP